MWLFLNIFQYCLVQVILKKLKFVTNFKDLDVYIKKCVNIRLCWEHVQHRLTICLH